MIKKLKEYIEFLTSIEVGIFNFFKSPARFNVDKLVNDLVEWTLEIEPASLKAECMTHVRQFSYHANEYAWPTGERPEYILRRELLYCLEIITAMQAVCVAEYELRTMKEF